MGANQKRAIAVGTLAGLLVGLLFWSRFGLHGVVMCLVGGAGCGASLYGLVYGELPDPRRSYPVQLLVGRKARILAAAYIGVVIYLAYGSLSA